MQRPDEMRLINLLWLLGAFTFRPSFGNNTQSDAPVDALRACLSLPDLVLLSATIDIPLLECLTCNLTSMDTSARLVTYTWHVKGQEGEQPKSFPIDYVISADEPDHGVGIIDFDTADPVQAQVVYSDYKTCMIDKMFYRSQTLCLQWVKRGIENDVPESCNEAMNEKCGGGVLLYEDDVCK